MPKIKLTLEDVTEEQAERISAELGNIAGCKVTVVSIPLLAEFTPEQEEAFNREWEKPGPITWLPPMPSPEPGPAVGDTFSREFLDRARRTAFSESLEDIDADTALPGRPILPPGWSQDVMTGMITDDHGQAQGIPIDWTRPLTHKETVSVLYAQIRDALEQIVDRYSDLEGQIHAEGEHTAAANAEIERLQAVIARHEGKAP
jgi:hypothetical protein